MSQYHQTRQEIFLTAVLDELTQVVRRKIDLQANNRNWDAIRNIVDDSEEKCKKFQTVDPRDIPISCVRFHKIDSYSENFVNSLNDGGYETLGDLIDAWPVTILSCPGIGQDGCHTIYDVLRNSGLLKR